MSKTSYIKSCFLLCVSTFIAEGAEIALVPVGASGSHAIVGNEIILDGGNQRVFLEIRVADWAPDRLKSWGAVIDASGYSSGVQGMLVPSVETCTADADCVTAFGSGATCTVSDGAGLSCTPGFIGFARPDYVFANVADLFGVDLRSLDYRYASSVAVAPPVVDPGSARYAGTLVLDVPREATGTFTIGLVSGMNTALVNEDFQNITPLVLTPARISVTCVPKSCDDGDVCTDDACWVGGICTHESNFEDTAYCCDPADGTLCDKPPGLPGDFNGSGSADLADVARLQECFGLASVDPTCNGVDMDCDCDLDANDVLPFTSALTGP